MEKSIQEEKINVLKRKSYNNNDAGNVFFWSVISPYLVLFVILFLAMFIGKNLGYESEEITGSQVLLIFSALATPLTFLGVFLIYNKLNNISIKACKFSFKMSVKQVFILIAISLICIFSLQYLIYGVNLGLKEIGYNLDEISLPLNNFWWYLLNVALLAVLPAICEEVVFRGVIFNGLRSKMSDVWAVLLSSALFMIMHGRLEQFVYPFVLGIVLSFVVLRTGNLFSSILVHFLNNFIVVTMGFIEEMTGFSFIPSSKVLLAVLMIVLFTVGVFLIYLIDKFFFKHKTLLEKDEGVKEGEAIKSNSLSKFMILGICLSLLLFIVNVVSNFL